MSHFEGKTWMRHDHEEGLHVHVYNGSFASLDAQPVETYVQTSEGWTKDGEPVDVLLADDLDVLTAEVDLANE